jgi:DNA repair photolyase
MVVRDTDVLGEIGRRTSCTVCISVPTVDEDAWRALEPGTAPPMQRLRAVRELVDAGIRAGVLMNPIVPGISSRPAQIERTVKAIADHGAQFVGCNVLFLEGGTRDHFMHFLEREFPHLTGGYQQLYAGKYASEAYRAEVRRVVGLMKQKYGLGARDRYEDDRPAPTERVVEQQLIEWKD